MVMQKISILLSISALVLSCNSSKSMLIKEQESNDNYTDISSLLSVNEFEEIKDFILEKGNKMTYRNIDSNNPHYKFNNCDVFLAADVVNINNDPKISDFNQLTIVDWDSNIRYYGIVIIRKGDLNANKAWITKEMKEKRVYLVDNYNKGLELMKANLPNYIKQVKKEVKY